MARKKIAPHKKSAAKIKASKRTAKNKADEVYTIPCKCCGKPTECLPGDPEMCSRCWDNIAFAGF